MTRRFALGLFCCCALSALATAQTYTEDFNDGVANGWLFDQGDWSVQNNQLWGNGVLQGGRVFNVGYVDQFLGLDMSVRADLHTDNLRSDDVSHMIVLRYINKDNFVVVNWRSGFRHDVVVEQVVNGNRTYVVPEFQNNIPEIGQTEYHSFRVDVLGTRVVAWMDGTVYLDKNVPALAQFFGSPGVACFGSGGGREQVFADNFVAHLAHLAPVQSVQVGPGRYVSGTLDSFNGNAGDYYVIANGPRANQQSPHMRLVTNYTLNYGNLSELIVRCTSQTSVGGLLQVIELFNWTTQQYELVDSRQTTNGDRTVRASIVQDPNRFCQAGTNSVKCRVSYYQNGPVPVPNFEARINELRIHAVTQ